MDHTDFVEEERTQKEFYKKENEKLKEEIRKLRDRINTLEYDRDYNRYNY